MTILTIIHILIHILIICTNVDSLIMKGTLSSQDKDWKLLGYFCFLPNVGRMQFKVDYPYSYVAQNLLFYYDDQWSNVYPQPSLSCAEKEYKLDSSQIFNLTAYNSETFIYNPNCISDNEETTTKITCFFNITFIEARSRFWYIVVDRCFPKNTNVKGLNINYYALFTNGDDAFHRQFSADEFGIFETSIAMFLTYFLMGNVAIVFSVVLIKKHYFHSTFKLFVLSLFFQFVYFLFVMSEYAQFSSSGTWTSGFLTIARIIDAAAQIIFLLMLILIAKGYTVTRGRLSGITRIKLVVFFIIYIIAYAATFIISETLFDPGLINYYLSSPGGIALVCIKLVLGWPWFCYAIFFTIKNYPEKRKFYIILLIFFTLWFWAGPVIIIITSYVIQDRFKQQVAFITQSIIAFLGHGYFLILTRPTSGNNAFPYHIKTTQIDVLNENSSQEAQNFPHHSAGLGGNIDFIDTTPMSLTGLLRIKNPLNTYAVDENHDIYSEENQQTEPVTISNPTSRIQMVTVKPTPKSATTSTSSVPNEETQKIEKN